MMAIVVALQAVLVVLLVLSVADVWSHVRRLERRVRRLEGEDTK